MSITYEITTTASLVDGGDDGLTLKNIGKVPVYYADPPTATPLAGTTEELEALGNIVRPGDSLSIRGLVQFTVATDASESECLLLDVRHSVSTQMGVYQHRGNLYCPVYADTPGEVLESFIKSQSKGSRGLRLTFLQSTDVRPLCYIMEGRISKARHLSFLGDRNDNTTVSTANRDAVTLKYLATLGNGKYHEWDIGSEHDGADQLLFWYYAVSGDRNINVLVNGEVRANVDFSVPDGMESGSNLANVAHLNLSKPLAAGDVLRVEGVGDSAALLQGVCLVWRDTDPSDDEERELQWPWNPRLQGRSSLEFAMLWRLDSEGSGQDWTGGSAHNQASDLPQTNVTETITVDGGAYTPSAGLWSSGEIIMDRTSRLTSAGAGDGGSIDERYCITGNGLHYSNRIVFANDVYVQSQYAAMLPLNDDGTNVDLVIDGVYGVDGADLYGLDTSLSGGDYIDVPVATSNIRVVWNDDGCDIIQKIAPIVPGPIRGIINFRDYPLVKHYVAFPTGVVRSAGSEMTQGWSLLAD